MLASGAVAPVVRSALALALLLGAMRAPAADVSVAAAADLKFALDSVLVDFRKERPDLDVKVTYGSSGNFFSQLSNGAPFDVFLSADAEYPRKLEEAGLVLEGTRFLYAVGRIVLFVPLASPLEIEKSGIKALADPRVRHVAIANPRHAPYGRAAEAALRSLGVYDAVKEKLVLGENVAQTAQFVETGSADAGIIALGLAVAPGLRTTGRFVEIPLSSYPEIEQGGAILRSTKEPEAARALRMFLLGPKAQGTLKRFGFFLPDA